MLELLHSYTDFRDAENNRLAICKLITGGIGDNPINDSGTTPLHHPAKNSNLEIFKLFAKIVTTGIQRSGIWEIGPKNGIILNWWEQFAALKKGYIHLVSVAFN